MLPIGKPRATDLQAMAWEIDDGLPSEDTNQWCAGDGVLVDTEAEGHRVAFNQAFQERGLKHEWSLDLYGKLLEIGGGKERMNAYFSQREGEEPYKSITVRACGLGANPVTVSSL